MLSIQLYILPGCLAAVGLVLGGLFLHGADLKRRPMMFGQATVVALTDGRASFKLFDGQIIDLALDRNAALHVGDYGRLTYRAGRFVAWE